MVAVSSFLNFPASTSFVLVSPKSAYAQAYISLTARRTVPTSYITHHMPVWKLQKKCSSAFSTTDWPCPNRLRTIRAHIGIIKISVEGF
jgi:hypothetical protein